MPYFSFSLKSFPDKDLIDFKTFTSTNIRVGTKYYSKNTRLWKALNQKKNTSILSSLSRESRKKNVNLFPSILFCLPPSIALGDAIEYGLAIKAIDKHKSFKRIGVAFANKYKNIFIHYFNIKNVYDDVLSIKDLNYYETIFHFTYEIKQLHFQKFDRQNIEHLINDYFSLLLGLE